MNLKSYSFAFSTIILLGLFQLSGCDGDNPKPSAADQVKAKLISATWIIQNTMVDDVDETAIYAGLTLSFTATGYQSTNGKATWPASGTWSFNSTDGTTIKRDDGLIIVVEVTDSLLKLSYDWAETTLGGGKTGSVPGSHILTFTKQ